MLLAVLFGVILLTSLLPFFSSRPLKPDVCTSDDKILLRELADKLEKDAKFITGVNAIIFVRRGEELGLDVKF